MYEGVDGDRPAQKDDERCTRIGRWLRATRIDELPQLWNIFRGDMHLVGPRPFVPEQESRLEEQIPFYNLRWSVRPGATGWAQVNRGYCSTVAENAEKLAYDLFYIKHLSVGLDLLVIFKTFQDIAARPGCPMTACAGFVFWSSLLGIVYTYFGYPCCCLFVTGCRKCCAICVT